MFKHAWFFRFKKSFKHFVTIQKRKRIFRVLSGPFCGNLGTLYIQR